MKKKAIKKKDQGHKTQQQQKIVGGLSQGQRREIE